MRNYCDWIRNVDVREEVLAINFVRDVVTIKTAEKHSTELASNWLRAKQVVGDYVIA